MIVIVDFGSQTAHLIGRRLRQLGVTTHYLYPHEVDQFLKKKGFTPYGQSPIRGIILSGGPASVYEKGAPTVSAKIFSLKLPILGICYGWQLMARLLGGRVENTRKEYGPEEVHFKKRGGIFSLPKRSCSVFMSHGDTVVRLPKGFEVAGSTRSVINTAVIDSNRRFFGVQFHPEAHHTEQGLELLRNFAADTCGETPTPLSLRPFSMIKSIKETSGTKKVICAVSGGVDSTVAAFLIGRAIGKRLLPVYIESGLMRPGTKERVKYIFTKLIRAKLIVIDARKQFLSKLKGVTDPEKKRETIGALYIDLFQKEANKHKDVAFLGQGTIYSDVIESQGTKLSAKIKSHHNVAGLPKSLKLKLIEPLRNFYKDEVRQLGKLAGLPADIVNQQPFPGPGYAVRIRGEVTKERLEQVRKADAIVVREMKKANLFDQVFQCFAVMTGAFSTAVKGDTRVFGEVVAIRAYESADIMTSDWSRLPYEVLARMSCRIVNEVPGISRVVYDVTTKPPATMEWE